MPATSEKQRRFMGAELARKRAGQKMKTDMSTKQLSEFATMKPKSNMPKGGPGANQPMGDVGVLRQEEGVKLGGFKDGATVKTAGKL